MPTAKSTHARVPGTRRHSAGAVASAPPAASGESLALCAKWPHYPLELRNNFTDFTYFLRIEDDELIWEGDLRRTRFSLADAHPRSSDGVN